VLTYTYYISLGEKALTPLVFLHGWHDHAALWAMVASPLRSTKHPIIIPDMLDYDGTNKPTDSSAYNWNVMTKDIFENIDAEDHHEAIIIGHDWSSIAASAVYHYYPKRVVGSVNISVAYLVPAREPFDLGQMDNMT
jgi:soluble epoxide hydrolase/lipid-phosphate phosphatase